MEENNKAFIANEYEDKNPTLDNLVSYLIQRNAENINYNETYERFLKNINTPEKKKNNHVTSSSTTAKEINIRDFSSTEPEIILISPSSQDMEEEEENINVQEKEIMPSSEQAMENENNDDVNDDKESPLSYFCEKSNTASEVDLSPSQQEEQQHQHEKQSLSSSLNILLKDQENIFERYKLILEEIQGLKGKINEICIIIFNMTIQHQNSQQTFNMLPSITSAIEDEYRVFEKLTKTEKEAFEIEQELLECLRKIINITN